MKIRFMSKIMLLIICASILTATVAATTTNTTQITKQGGTGEVIQYWTHKGTEFSTMQPKIILPKGATGLWNILGFIYFKDGSRKNYNDWGLISPGILEYWGFKAEDPYMVSADLRGEWG